MNIQKEDISARILPCVESKPYVFISYSSKDRDYVLSDVEQLQKQGFNIWVDTNLNALDKDWKVALSKIQSPLCSLVLFYMSAHSLTSVNCQHELETTLSEDSLMLHQHQQVRIVTVDAEPLGNIDEFRSTLFESITTDPLSHMPNPQQICSLSFDERSRAIHEATGQYVRASSTILDECLHMTQETPRILHRDVKCARHHSLTQYYNEIGSVLIRCGVTMFPPEDRYDIAVSWLEDPTRTAQALWVLRRLQAQAFFPAQCLMLFLYSTGTYVRKNLQKANAIYASISDQSPAQMAAYARNQMNSGFYSRAAAVHAAAGLRGSDKAENAMYAARLWLSLSRPNFTLCRICAAAAQQEGSREAADLISILNHSTDEELLRQLK